MQREFVEMDYKANLLIGMNSNDEEKMLNYTKLFQTIPNYSKLLQRWEIKRNINLYDWKDNNTSSETEYGHMITLIQGFTRDYNIHKSRFHKVKMFSVKTQSIDSEIDSMELFLHIE